MTKGAALDRVGRALAKSREILSGTSFYKEVAAGPLFGKTREIGDFYDKRFGRTYDAHMEKTGHYKAMDAFLDFLVERMPKGVLVLDPACGTGHVAFYLIEQRPDLRIIVNDISKTMLASAVEKLERHIGERVLVTQHDAAKLPFVDETFTRIILSYGMHWFEDKLAVGEEMQRVLKKDCGLLFSVEEWPLLVTPTEYSAKFGAGILERVTPLNVEDNTLNWEFYRAGFGSLNPGFAVPIDSKHNMHFRTYASRLGNNGYF